MSEHSGLAQIKKELDMRRARIKKEHEERVHEFEKHVKQHKEKISAYEKRRDLKIARIEESFDRRTATALKKLLGEETYERLYEWLLKKRQKELQEIERIIQPTEHEDWGKQLDILQEKDPRSLIWVYYLDNKSRFSEELEEDIGIKI